MKTTRWLIPSALAAGLVWTILGTGCGKAPPEPVGGGDGAGSAAVAATAKLKPSECVRGENEFELMNTAGSMVVYVATQPEGAQAIQAAMDRLTRIEQLLNRYSDLSEIAAINRAAGQAEPVAISDLTQRAILWGTILNRQTGGAFNPLVGSEVALWARGAAEQKLPTAEALAAAVALTDVNDIELGLSPGGQPTCRLRRAGMQLDLGGVAKGWAAEEAVRAMRAAVPGLRAAMVMIGGDGLGWCEPDWFRPWRYTIQDPLRPEEPGASYATVQAYDAAVVTSGPYYRWHEIGGKKFNHILDPRTARPIDNNVVSVTVIHNSGAIADGLATAAVVLGPREGVALLEKNSAEGLILELQDGQLVRHQTAGFRNLEVAGGRRR